MDDNTSNNNIKPAQGIKFNESSKYIAGLDIKDVIHSPAKESSKINRIKELKNKKAEHEQVIEGLKSVYDQCSRD